MDPLESSLTILVGLPGSGKSYWIARRLAETVEARPIYYGNLPLNVTAFQEHYEATTGREAPPLVELSREHFVRFAQRLSLLRNKMLEFTAAGQQPGPAFHLAKDWLLNNHGPDIPEGPDANWIIEGAVLYLDEFQTWFPQRLQHQEPLEIMCYFTMYRHLQHKIVAATQRALNLSKSIREMASDYVFVTNKIRQSKILRMLHFAWFQYVHYIAEDVPVTGKPPKSTVKPSTVTHVFRPRKEIYRLYESYSLSDRSADQKERTETHRPKRHWLRYIIMIGICIGLIRGCASSCANLKLPVLKIPTATTPETPEKTIPKTPPGSLAVPHTTPLAPSTEHHLHTLTGTTKTAAIIDDGTVCRIGDIYDGATLLLINGRITIWTDRGRTIFWRIGSNPQLYTQEITR